MSSPGTLRFGQVFATPSAPPVGYDLIYVKTDDVLYIQDSAGVEVALGSASSITQLVGEVTAVGPGIATATVSNSAVIGKVLTGFVPGPNSTVLATDTVLQAFEKLQAQVSAGAASAITSLTGDVTGTGPGATAATVVSVGGSSAANINSATLAANAATSSNTASTIVKRDASGNFAANIITASLNGNASTATTAVSFTGALSGDVTGTQSATVVSTVGGKSASDIAQSVSDTQAATSSNTASTIVKRDASGNFSANIITASLLGNVTGNVSGSSSSFTGALVGDVTGTQGATVVSTVGGKTAAEVAQSVSDTQAATSLNTALTLVKRDASGDFAAGQITASLLGNVTGNVSGSSSSFTGSLAGDVTGTQSATSISSTTVTGKLLTGYVVGSNTPIASTDTILLAFEKVQGQLNATTGAAITALTGDVVATGPGSVSATIQPNVVSNSKLAQMPANTVKGNNTGATANAVDLTVSQLVSMASSVVVTQLPDQSNSAGTAPFFSRADHIHNIPSGLPVQIGTTNAQGSAASFSLSDHVHAHGNQTSGTLHAAVTTLVNGFMSFTDKVKLDAITGTNTGDVTLAAVGASPNANAASLSGQVLNLQPADASFPGVVTTLTQTFAGNKTFSGQTAITNSSTTALAINSTSFVFDATNNAFGIGIAPSTTSFIDGVNTTGATKRLVLTGYGAGSTVGFRNRFARGTSGSPSAVQTSDILGFISGQGYGTSQFPAASTGVANFVAGENFTNTSNFTYFVVQTTPTASVTAAESFRVASTGTTLGPQSSSTAIHKVSGGLYQTVRTITGDLTIDTTTTDYYILCNQSGAINVTLPPPVAGRVLVIKDISGTASTNNITLVRNGSEQIEGIAASRLLQTNWGCWTITTDGTNWFIVS